jgi:uncharacterized membrane protein
MNPRPLIAAGILLGVGMGGFVDGIVFHQLFQTHNMLSAKVPPDTLVNAKINMVWDGLFHVLAWVMTALGLGLLWHAGKERDASWSGRTLLASMIAGWGLFNFVEGLIDHHILGIHHVMERLGVSAYDYAFLASGILFMAIGWGLIHTGPGDGYSRQSRPS